MPCTHMWWSDGLQSAASGPAAKGKGKPGASKPKAGPSSQTKKKGKSGKKMGSDEDDDDDDYDDQAERDEEGEEEDGGGGGGGGAGPSHSLKDRRNAFHRWYLGMKGGEDDGGGWADQAEREAQAMIEAGEEAAEEQRGRGAAGQLSILHQVGAGGGGGEQQREGEEEGSWATLQTCSGIRCSDGGCLRPLQDPQQMKWSILRTALSPPPHPPMAGALAPHRT